MTLGEALIRLLEAYHVDTVFGIPGVHTVELYRGLASSKIRHITPRHEQGAGFMADGYARASGRPGVAFVITGPGLSNTITAMGQARADSVPMLVISGVNASSTLGLGLGYLHELPDQRGMMEKVALISERITQPEELPDALARAFALFTSSRAGPVHIEIPIDVMALPADGISFEVTRTEPAKPDHALTSKAAQLIAAANRPLILVGGGAKAAGSELERLAEQINAPVVQTTNARGLMHGHRLTVPASPSLHAVRKLIADADVVIAAGTEFGPTDYDMYGDNGLVIPATLVRIDIDASQLKRHTATIGIQADCCTALLALCDALGPNLANHENGGAERAHLTRDAAFSEIGSAMQVQVRAVEHIRDALPGALIVGDSTQPVYAANLYYDHDRPGGWFNAATGFGALGYGPPAAIGASIALPGVPIVCLSGDGGFQFTLSEIAVAADTGAPVIFVIWNNYGYREIETSMRSAQVEPVGVSPVPPDFMKLATAYGIYAERIDSIEELRPTLTRAHTKRQPCIIEIAIE